MPKDETLKIRVSGAERDRIAAAAAHERRSMSSFVRMAALNRAVEVLGADGADPIVGSSTDTPDTAPELVVTSEDRDWRHYMVFYAGVLAEHQRKCA